MDINQPFVTQEQKFKYWEESKAEIQNLRAKVELLVEALRWAEIALQDALGKFSKNNDVQHDAIQEIRTALATYDKQSEVKHDTE